LPLQDLPRHAVTLRGRSAPISACAVTRAADLAAWTGGETINDFAVRDTMNTNLNA
jgi:hypothetical protein